jgi:threonine/homoserine/homoserine lactone efflux protein
MILISLFFFGFFSSFIGSITPSMLNMTAIKVSLEKGIEASKKYALGVSFIAIPQVVIAVILTRYIAENPTILETLEKAGIIIFIGLSYYFYNESKKGKIKTESIKSKKENPFLTGITLSFLNMFAIPFFCGIIVALDLFELFSFEVFPIFFFILGTILGTFCILFVYARFANIIQQKTGKLTKDINIILSVLTALVALITFIKLFI